MSRIYQEIVSGMFAVAPQYAGAYGKIVASILKDPQAYKDDEDTPGYDSPEGASFAKHGNKFRFLIPAADATIVFYNEWGMPSLDMVPEGTTAVIEISGAITKYDQMCGPMGMLTATAAARKMLSHKNIDALFFKIESPGGSAYASDMMYNNILQMKADYGKPIYAFVEDLTASGGYYLASACDQIFANTERAMIGSIGTMQTLWDIRKQLEMEGVNLIEIYAPVSTDKNKDYRDALDGDTTAIQQQLAVLNEAFLSSVENGRGNRISERKKWGTGKMFFASEAAELGLIDGIAPNIQSVIKSITI